MRDPTVGCFYSCTHRGQFGWKPASAGAPSKAWSPNALQKLGGHPHTFFVKAVVPSSQRDKMVLSARSARCGISIDAFEATLYPSNLLLELIY